MNFSYVRSLLENKMQVAFSTCLTISMDKTATNGLLSFYILDIKMCAQAEILD